MHLWNAEWAPSAEEWSAFWAFCSLVVTTGAATLALIQLRAYFVERFESSRPYVMVNFEFRSEIILEVVVRNYSATPASNVRVASEPGFESTMAGRAEVFAKITDDAYVIRHLGPGRKPRWTLDRAPDYFKDAAMPRSYEVTVSYEDPRAPLRGPRWRNRPGVSRRLSLSALISTTKPQLILTGTTRIGTLLNGTRAGLVSC
jgi:hypothetical protein